MSVGVETFVKKKNQILSIKDLTIEFQIVESLMFHVEMRQRQKSNKTIDNTFLCFRRCYCLCVVAGIVMIIIRLHWRYAL